MTTFYFEPFTTLEILGPLPDMPLEFLPESWQEAATMKKKRKRRKATTAITKKTKKRNRQRPHRIRRVIPEDLTELYIDDELRATDVISGRGGLSNHHEGNKPYWRLVYERRPNYRASETATEKNAIAEEIVATIHSQQGRFLQREKGTKKWFLLPKKVIIDKVKQALRDKYIPEFLKEELGVQDQEKIESSHPSLSQLYLESASSLPTFDCKSLRQETVSFSAANASTSKISCWTADLVENLCSGYSLVPV